MERAQWVELRESILISFLFFWILLICGDAVFGPVNSLRFAYQFRQQNTNFTPHSLTRSSGNGGSTQCKRSRMTYARDFWTVALRIMGLVVYRAICVCVRTLFAYWKCQCFAITQIEVWMHKQKESEYLPAYTRSSCAVLASIGRVVRSFLFVTLQPNDKRVWLEWFALQMRHACWLQHV